MQLNSISYNIWQFIINNIDEIHPYTFEKDSKRYIGFSHLIESYEKNLIEKFPERDPDENFNNKYSTAILDDTVDYLNRTVSPSIMRIEDQIILLVNDIKKIEALINKNVTYELDQNKFDALVSFLFSIRYENDFIETYNRIFSDLNIKKQNANLDYIEDIHAENYNRRLSELNIFKYSSYNNISGSNNSIYFRFFTYYLAITKKDNSYLKYEYNIYANSINDAINNCTNSKFDIKVLDTIKGFVYPLKSSSSTGWENTGIKADELICGGWFGASRNYGREFHLGIDLVNKISDEVFAPTNGIVMGYTDSINEVSSIAKNYDKEGIPTPKTIWIKYTPLKYEIDSDHYEEAKRVHSNDIWIGIAYLSNINPEVDLPFKPGDPVETGDLIGYAEDVSLLSDELSEAGENFTHIEFRYGSISGRAINPMLLFNKFYVFNITCNISGVSIIINGIRYNEEQFPINVNFSSNTRISYTIHFDSGKFKDYHKTFNITKDTKLNITDDMLERVFSELTVNVSGNDGQAFNIGFQYTYQEQKRTTNITSSDQIIRMNPNSNYSYALIEQDPSNPKYDPLSGSGSIINDDEIQLILNPLVPITTYTLYIILNIVDSLIDTITVNNSNIKSSYDSENNKYSIKLADNTAYTVIVTPKDDSGYSENTFNGVISQDTTINITLIINDSALEEKIREVTNEIISELRIDFENDVDSRIGLIEWYPANYSDDSGYYLLCDNSIHDNIDFPKLANILGRKYSQSDDPANTFRTPLLTDNRFIEGISNGSAGIYKDAGAPSITHTHTRGTMEISGSIGGPTNYITAANTLNQIATGYGAFKTDAVAYYGGYGAYGASNGYAYGQKIDFDASRNWTGNTSDNSTVSNIYGASDTIQPKSLTLVPLIRAK